MVWRHTIEMTPAEILNFSSLAVSFLVIFLILLFLAFNFKLDFKFSKWFSKFLKKRHRQIIFFLGILIAIFILSFVVLQSMVDSMDRATTVYVDEKILIIELDDWWNFGDTEIYYGPYGYTFDRFQEVTDIIDKYDFVATMGVTPYIFVESTGENFPLRDDPKMIDYIEDMVRNGYEIGMHGYNHCRNEYYCPQYEEVWYNVDTGKRELEEIFDTKLVSYFPPGNKWTTDQYENVKRAGFKLIGNTHVPKAYFDEDVIITPRGYDPIYVYEWYARNFLHIPGDEWIEAYDDSNLFILQLHQNTFDNQEKLDDLDKFLAYVKEDGAKVMTYAEFYEYMIEKVQEERGSLTGKVVLEVK
jgi:predicted deacetylase